MLHRGVTWCNRCNRKATSPKNRLHQLHLKKTGVTAARPLFMRLLHGLHQLHLKQHILQTLRAFL